MTKHKKKMTLWQKYKEIRKYSNFTYSKTYLESRRNKKKAVAAINSVYRTWKKNRSGGKSEFFAPSKKETLKRAKRQYRQKSKHTRGVWVRTAGKKNKLKENKRGKIISSSKYAEQELFKFTKRERDLIIGGLINEDTEYIAEIISSVVDRIPTDYRYIKLSWKEQKESAAPIERGVAADHIADLLMTVYQEYENEEEGSNKISKFIFGLVALKFKNQKSFKSYLKAKDAAYAKKGRQK